MAQHFNELGVPALAVDADTAAEQRRGALAALRERRVNVLFAVDLFNEGLDIPDVDTLLLLRPTASATVFLQQLGRGLRRTEGKSVLTVLDFGQQRQEFRFDIRYGALTGVRRKALAAQVEQGFPYLPAGAQILLARVTQEQVLERLRGQLRLTRRQRAADVRVLGSTALAKYLTDAQADLADVYRNGSWSGLVRDAGLPWPDPGRSEAALLRRIHALLHVDDAERVTAYTSLLSAAAPVYDDLPGRDQTYARMLGFTLWPNLGGFTSYDDGLRLDRAAHVPLPLPSDVPLATHAWYRREGLLAALDWASLQRWATSPESPGRKPPRPMR